MRTRSSLSSAQLVLVALSLGCGGDANKKASPDDLAKRCTSDQSCSFGECVRLEAFEAGGSDGTYCTTACTKTSDCADYGKDAVCGLSGHCILSCDSPTWQNVSGNAILCADSIPNDCTALEGRMCDKCGCDYEEYCDTRTNTCKPTRANGEKCEVDIECEEFSCGKPEKGSDDVCLVHLGEPCTDETCERCANPGPEGGYCTTNCDADDAPSETKWGSRTYYCITDTETGRSWYKLGCAPSLPCTVGEACIATRDREVTFCDPLE